MFRRSLITIALLGASLAAAPAWAQQPVVGIATSTTYTVDGRITAVDPNARTVTLTLADGVVTTRKVSPAVANLAAAKVGDMVTAAFEDKRTFVLSGANTPTPPARNVATAAAISTPAGAVGAASDLSIANWWVTAVDPAANKISLVNPGGGMIRTWDVTNPEGRQQLSRVKPGDNLTVIDSSVVVAALTPKA
jgi:hypothetical protein